MGHQFPTPNIKLSIALQPSDLLLTQGLTQYLIILEGIFLEYLLYPRLDTRVSVHHFLSIRLYRSGYPNWILKWGWLENTDQRQFFVNGKTKIKAFFCDSFNWIVFSLDYLGRRKTFFSGVCCFLFCWWDFWISWDFLDFLFWIFPKLLRTIILTITSTPPVPLPPSHRLQKLAHVAGHIF